MRRWGTSSPAPSATPSIKIFGFGLLAPIFDLTTPKLMTLPWFAFVYDKALVFHHFALGLIAPYRAAAKKLAGELFARVRALWTRRTRGGERRGALTRRAWRRRRFCPIGFGGTTIGRARA